MRCKVGEEVRVCGKSVGGKCWVWERVGGKECVEKGGWKRMFWKRVCGKECAEKGIWRRAHMYEWIKH